MTDEVTVERAADSPLRKSMFVAAAEEHMRSLEVAGESPNEIAAQLSAVADSYAADGLSDEAEALRALIHQHRSKWTAGTDGNRRV